MVRTQWTSVALALVVVWTLLLGCTTKPTQVAPTPPEKPAASAPSTSEKPSAPAPPTTGKPAASAPAPAEKPAASGPAPGQKSAAPASSPAAKPQGTLTIAFPDLGKESFLGWQGDSSANWMWELVYEWPFYIGAQSRKFYPGLATRYEFTPDYKKLTLYLREGVQFHDGWGELTADDIKYTFDRHLAKEATSAVPLLRERTERIDVVNRYTVAFYFKKPSPEMTRFLNQGLTPTLPILSKKYVESVGDEKASANPIGTGAYRVVERKPADYVKFEAVDNHWRTVPEFKTVIMRVVPEQSTRLAMLKTGAIDITDITVEQVPEVKAAGLQTRVRDSGSQIYLNLGGLLDPADKAFKAGYHLTDPWADVRVREAMNIAIDRDAINKAFYGGLAKIMPVAEVMPGSKDLPKRPYDPERAKRLLAEAGYPNGFGFEMWSYPFAPATELPVLISAIAGYWEQIGLRPKIQSYAGWQAVRGKVVTDRSTKAVIWGMRSTYNDDYSTIYYSKFMPEGGNLSFQSPELTAMVRTLDGVLEQDKRDAIMTKITRYMFDNWVNVPVAVAPDTYGVSQKVGDWPSGSAFNPKYIEWIRHAKPLNTPRLFTPE